MSGALTINELHGPRFEVALELLATGGSFVFNDVEFCLYEGTLRCNAISSWVPGRLNAARAETELRRAESTLAALRETGNPFVELVGDAPTRVAVIHDYGSGSIELCHRDGGLVVWSGSIVEETRQRRMKVYLDDERTPPDGWVLVRWPDEAIELLATGEVVELSLDHDLGDDERGTGYAVPGSRV